MSKNYIAAAGTNFHPSLSEPIMDSIFQQYERVLVESLVTSFGLDFLVKDQYGGDVDTILNVRKIGQDEQMTYKNKQNQTVYEQITPYTQIIDGKKVTVKSMYDADQRYKAINKEISQQRKDGVLVDAYTGQKVPRNAQIELDHVISTKEIHEDRGRALAGLDGLSLANCRENLQPTDHSINESMKQKPIDEYCKWLKATEPKRAAEIERLRSKPQSELTDKERKLLHKYEQQAAIDPELMKKRDAEARKSYEDKLARAYYTSPKFAKDTALAAGNAGMCMGARQALGFVFAEIWFAVKREFQKVKEQEGALDLSKFLHAIGNGVKRGFEEAKQKFSGLFARFLSGSIAGALSSLTTTLCNIFFTTAKNTVRIIRQCYASLVEAAKVLFINPQDYTFGDRIRAVVKILATGASVVAGVLVSDAIGKTPINALPVAGDIIQTFCGSFVTGIMSCTLLYFFDRNETINKLVRSLDELHTIETEINYYQKQAEYFERYAAELMNIDTAQFKRETALYGDIASRLEGAETGRELNAVLKQAIQDIGIAIPWEGHESFGDFMADKKAVLVFG